MGALQINESIIYMAKDLEFHRTEKLMMVMMMMVTAIKMRKGGCVRERESERKSGEGSSVSMVTYQNLSPGGGVADGEVASSPGCSGMSVSPGEPGPCIPGGVEEALRASVDEPLRDTQDVSITRTPILEKNHIARVIYDAETNAVSRVGVVRKEVSGRKT